MDIHQFGHIPVSICYILVFESIPEGSAFFGNDIAFLRSSFGLADSSDELPAGMGSILRD